MALVGYSDSEDSETEQVSAQPKAPRLAVKDATASGGSKSGFQKVIDKSNPHRIRVELPAVSNEDPAEEFPIGGDRPAKKAKTAGTFGGFNSFLPAPKNANKPSSGAAQGGLLSGRLTGLKPGISLKTGAAPAFSRELPTESEYEPAWEVEQELNFGPPKLVDNDESEKVQGDSLPDVKEDVKPIGNRSMFKPLSVGRKNPMKKKPTPRPAQDQSSDNPSAGSQRLVQESASTTVKTAAVIPRPKRSLFSSIEDDEPETSIAAANGHYEPLLEDTQDADGEKVEEDQARLTASSSTMTPQTQTQPSDLNALADSLGLTPAQRRQLFGRTATAKGTEVAHFSVSAEYSNNNQLLANDANAAPAHNPVRSIAPGKHSLKQLLNAASSQKDALEESFASGKRNKADAGSRKATRPSRSTTQTVGPPFELICAAEPGKDGKRGYRRKGPGDYDISSKELFHTRDLTASLAIRQRTTGLQDAEVEALVVNFL